MAFGGAVTIGAWRMDRLERLNINKYEAPGLVPGLLGFAVLLLGVMLAVRAIRAGALAPAGRHDTSDWGRMAVVMAAMLGYSLLLVLLSATRQTHLRAISRLRCEVPRTCLRGRRAARALCVAGR